MRIVVVDDHQELRESLRRLLERRDGFEVVGEASDGEEAIGAVADSSPDVVLLDVNLPGQSGAECARHLKESFPHVRLVAWSGETLGSEEMLEAGADAFVLKGGPSQELFDALEPIETARPTEASE